MKKILPLALVAFLIASCSRDKGCVYPEIETEDTELNFTTQGGEHIIKFSSSVAPKVTTNVDWIVTDLTQIDNDYTLTIKPNAYNGFITRKGKVFLTTFDKVETITVEQNGYSKTQGVLILSEAGWGQGKADLAYYDLKKDELKTKLFSSVNGKTIGDVGNDIGFYGSKLYIAVSGTDIASANSYISVVDPSDYKLIKEIPMTKKDGSAEQARRMVFHEGKIYITGYSGTIAQVDTTSLSITAHATLSGNYPEGKDMLFTEGIAAHEGKLYACNSGQGEGNTISVVDIASMKEIASIETPKNPVNIYTTDKGEVYFNTFMLFQPKTPSNLYQLDTKSNKIVHDFDCPAGKLAITPDYIYTGDFSWDTYEDTVVKINRKTKEVSPIEFAQSEMYMVYSFDTNPLDGSLYVGSQGDDVAIFDKDLNFVKKLKVKVPYINKVVPLFK